MRGGIAGRLTSADVLGAVLLWGALAGFSPAGSGAEPSPASRATPVADGASRAVEVVDVRFPEAAARSLPEHGSWLPVYVELRVTSRDARIASLEGAVVDDRARRFSVREPVDVAPGAPRRAWLYLQASPCRLGLQTATFDVRSPGEGTVRTGDRWTLGSLLAGELSHRVLVVAEDAASGVPWPRGTAPFSRRSQNPPVESVDVLPSRALPGSVLGYHAFDLLVLREIGAEGLEPAQVHALRSWIHLGGYLVVAPAARSGDLYQEEILRLLLGDRITEPRTLECTPSALSLRLAGTRPQPGNRTGNRTGDRTGDRTGAPDADRTGDLEDLGTMAPEADRTGDLEDLGTIPAGRRPRLLLEDPLGEVTPAASAMGAQKGAEKEIVATTPGPDGRDREFRLYAEVRHGAGRVGVLTPVGLWPQPDNAAFLQALWGGVLRCLYDVPGRGRRVWARLSNPVSPELHGLLSDESRDVGLPFITALIVGYLVLSGPVLYFVLKKLNRLPAVIWVEPLLVVVYLGVIFSVGYITKGVLTKTRIWTFLSQRRGDALALRESYFTIFSAEEASYRVESTNGFLLEPVFKNESSVKPIRLARRPGGAGPSEGCVLEDFLLAHWEQGHFVSFDVEDLGGDGVALEWPAIPESAAGGSPEGSPTIVVTNRLPAPIADGVVSDGRGGMLPVPRLEPGSEARVPLSVVDRGVPAEWKELLRRVGGLEQGGLAGGNLADGGTLRFAGRVETEEADFRVDRRSTLREKTVLYLLYDQP